MNFTVEAKVALITGAAGGLGYCLAKEFLKQGAKGLVLLDINEERGLEIQQEFQKEFGKSCCIFIKTDVSQYIQFEEAFKLTIETFKHLDIVINNAGIVSEVDWIKSININLVGCISGTKLAIDEYLPKYKSDTEGVIVNIASVVGLDPMGVTPVYTATKQGIVGMSRAYGLDEHYQRTKVRVITICPGHIRTPMVTQKHSNFYNRTYIKYSKDISKSNKYLAQGPKFVAESISSIIKEAANGSVWVVEGGEPAYEVEFGTRFTNRK